MSAQELAHDVVALYVDRNGPYPSRVAEWYDERRDARTYDGSLPVVAHPPCQRWCRLAGFVEARWGHKRGEDGGLFAHALAELRRVGGVLEHPAYSDAWAAYDLRRPTTGAGWVRGEHPTEWTCYVEQFRYGHLAKKATWLYYVGLRRPFELRWGVLSDHAAHGQTAAWRDSNQRASWTGNRGRSDWRDNVRPRAWVGYAGNNNNRGHVRPRLTKKQAASTPSAFLDVLLDLARWSQTYARS